MNWRALLRMDLAGKLGAWKRRYKKSRFIFDHQNVRCSLTEWGDGTFQVAACAYCDDPYLSFDIRPTAFFYRSRTFLSRIEAEAHLEAEIRRATRLYPSTKFYREREFVVVENGRVLDMPLVVEEYCQGGEWHEVDSTASSRSCPVCGYETEEVACPICQEFLP